jgi:DNA-directed DNA polymerase III PolC
VSRAVGEFTPLRVRSHGSLLYGTASPSALIARALELGYDSLALTDRDNLYLAIPFYREARAEGLRPLLGCTLGVAAGEVLLVPVDRRGYARMCALITASRLDPDFDLVRTLAASGEESPASGLHLVVESIGLAAALLHAGVPRARGVMERESRIEGGDGGLWMGVRGLARERPLLAERATAARTLGIPTVATGDCAMLEPADHEAHRAAVTAARGELIERMPLSAFCAGDAWLAPPAEWVRRVRAIASAAGVGAVASEALANNRLIAASVRLEIELGVPIFPRAPLPPGEDGRARLLRLGREGIAWRYRRGPGSAPALARLDQELGVIQRMGFNDYFLLVAEIVEFARARGIATVGRGSGASSLVAYVLGITNVDPLRYGLSFERFLNPSRRDCPDLDIDLCWKRRDEVIDHVYETYGHDRVAMISTHATLGARSAFRETAKALGVSNARVNQLARRIPRELERPYLARLAAQPEARAVDWREPVLAHALRLAERLDGAPRHLSVHCGGMVIADRPLTYYVPLERAAKDVVVTQFEMRAIEAIGLVKMDLLGNRALSTIAECVTHVRERGDVVPDLDRCADGDPATAAAIAAGDTLNCFQLESPAMRNLLRMLDAKSLDDTIAAVALVRPGPAESGMKEAFCRRHRGLERDEFLHPLLEPVLASTHGVMLYEEDVMRVAAALTGLSLAEGDDLRRAIGAARTDEEFRSLERGFVARALRAGIEEPAARAVWRDLTRFGAYAFCKAHAAGYGTLGYHCAYLKAHYTTEFAVGILNHHAGMYSTWVHVEDLRRRGVEFRPPCVWRSEWDTTFERDPGGDAAVRVGLSRVFGLAERAGARIIAARAARPFVSLADFIERARPSAAELEPLVLSGALDRLGRTRPSLLLEARIHATRPGRGGSRAKRSELAPAQVAHAHTGAAGSSESRRRDRVGRVEEACPVAGLADILPDPISPVAVPELPELDLPDRVRGECRATGLWFSAHPLDVFVSREAFAGVTPAIELDAHVRRHVAVAGLPCAYRRVETKSGESMMFVTLADKTGLAECVLFPDAYRAHAAAVRGEVLRIEGRVDQTLGAIAVTAERVTVASG